MTNCEKFKTAEERAEAFDKWCQGKDDCDQCELGLLHRSALTGSVCPIAWLDLEAEEEKIEDCPYCGAKCQFNHTVDEGWVECTNRKCKYESGDKGNQEATVAAHNRVARAVMAAGKEEK